MSEPRYCYDHPRPAVTADVVLVRVDRPRAGVLLVRRRRPPFAGRWALPGGFLDEAEDLEQAARRELREETGVGDLPLVELKSFSRPDRDPRGRVVTVAFLALTTEPPAFEAGDDAADAAWSDLHAPGPLAFDHQQVVQAAVARLREMLASGTIGYFFAGRTFSRGELGNVFSAIWDRLIEERHLGEMIQSCPAVARAADGADRFRFVYPPPAAAVVGGALHLP